MRALVLALALLGIGSADVTPARPPAAPTVRGPRRTTLLQPVYRFRAARAVAFRCAVDSRRLHRCAARYSPKLKPGRHVRRVRSVGRSGLRSRIVAVTIQVVPPLPAPDVGTPLAVGPGPGVPAVQGGSIWVPTTNDGGLVRITGGAVASRTQVGPRSQSGEGYLDAAVAGGGAIWSASDIGDPGSGAVRRTIPINPTVRRRGALIDAWWLAYGEGAVWATLPNCDTVARVDAATGAVQYVRLDHGQPFGITVGGGSAWVATDRAVVRLDGATGKPIAASSLPRTQSTGFVSVGYGDGAAWVTNFDRGTLVRVAP